MCGGLVAGGGRQHRIFLIYFFILRKYVTISKFSKSKLQPPYPMAVPANGGWTL
jgi:hypothetical protein